MINNCHHGEAFLWKGSGIDEIDNAIMDLIKLCEINPDVAKEMADEISANLSSWRHRRSGLDEPQ